MQRRDLENSYIEESLFSRLRVRPETNCGELNFVI